MTTEWEPVIGLEIHVQLSTKTKLFSAAPNRFGDEPNTNITEVCTGQPGALPVLNREAVRKAVELGCAIHGRVATFSKFDRKSYFYPDSPRNFQITQFDQPIIVGGHVTAQGKRFTIHHAHLEDDAGMLKHFTNFAGVDYNRAGVPLIEIVSDPCIHSAKEAVAYASAIKAIMEYIDASDCNMEEGSLRVDANISVRPKGEKTLRSKIEIKNMNSFSKMEEAIGKEIERQIHFYTLHPDGKLETGTYRYDMDKKEVILMRQKEEAMDYRYFPEPDLPPLILTEEYINAIRKSLPELPEERMQRYLTNYQLASDAAITLINDKRLSNFFEEAMRHTSHAKNLCNWIIVEFLGRLKEKNLSLADSRLSPLHIAQLINMIDRGIVTGKIAKMIADEMVEHPTKSPEAIVQENPDFVPLSDTAAIETLVDEVIAAHSEAISDYLKGNKRAFDFLVGQVMKRCKGKATPSTVNEILLRKINL